MSEDEEPSEVQDGCFLAFVWFISQDSDVAVDNEDDVVSCTSFVCLVMVASSLLMHENHLFFSLF